MKKQIYGIAALALAGVMSLGFAACGKSGGKDEFSAKVEAIEGKEVTAAQWDAALERLNNDDAELAVEFASVITVEGTIELPENGKKISTYTKQTDVWERATKSTKTYWKEIHAMEYGEEYKKAFMQDVDPDEIAAANWEGEAYGEETAEGYVYYGKNADGAWEKGDETVVRSEMDLSYNDEMKDDFLNSYADEHERYEDFGDYVYSAKHKGYIREAQRYDDELDETWNDRHVIKFDEEGRIVAAITVYWSDDCSITSDGRRGMAYELVCTWIFTYEVEDIILPTVA